MPVTTDINTAVKEQGHFKITDIGTLVVNMVNAALIAASIASLVYLIWGGIDWITSGGDKTKYEEARNKITYALFGLGVTAGSWLLWQLAIYFLGIGEFTSDREGVIFKFKP